MEIDQDYHHAYRRNSSNNSLYEGIVTTSQTTAPNQFPQRNGPGGPRSATVYPSPYSAPTHWVFNTATPYEPSPNEWRPPTSPTTLHQTAATNGHSTLPSGGALRTNPHRSLSPQPIPINRSALPPQPSFVQYEPHIQHRHHHHHPTNPSAGSGHPHKQRLAVSSPFEGEEYDDECMVEPKRFGSHKGDVKKSYGGRQITISLNTFIVGVVLLFMFALIAYGLQARYWNHRIRQSALSTHFSVLRQEEHFRDNDGEKEPTSKDDRPGEELVWVHNVGWVMKEKSIQKVEMSGSSSAAVSTVESHHESNVEPTKLVVPVIATDRIQEADKQEEPSSSAAVLPKNDDLIGVFKRLPWGLQRYVIADLNEQETDLAQEQVAMIEQEVGKALRYRAELRRYGTSHGGNLLVQVTGQKSIIKRDLPLIQEGYEMAFPSFRFVVQANEQSGNNKQQQPVDLLLCLSLSTCGSGKDDDHSQDLFESNPGSRVNRLPNLRQVLWSKQNLCRNIPKWLAELISFPCWILPEQESELMSFANSKEQKSQKWIAKPWSSGGGNGISVVEGVEGLLSLGKKNLVVQPFLMDPLLINQRKVDLRVYVLVTSVYPLRCYVHSRGLVRFASQVYDSSSSSRTQFLTNTSVNKKESNATAAELTWPFRSLFDHLGRDRGTQLRLGMDRAIALILLSVETKFASLLKGNICLKSDGSCYHLLGFDVILSSATQAAVPRVIEVNGEPSFARASKSSAAQSQPDGSTKSAGIDYHYDETKVIVARDIARIVFTAPSALMADVNRYEYHLLAQRKLMKYIAGSMLKKGIEMNTHLLQLVSEYAFEHLREMDVETEFRPCYPSPVAAFFPDQDSSLFHKTIQAGLEALPQLDDSDIPPLDVNARLALHESIHLHLHSLLWKRCITKSEDIGCYFGQNSVIQDILQERE